MRDTSWQKVGSWYKNLVGREGHYYQRQVIFPKLLNLLKLTDRSMVLDLGCGQGVFAQHLPRNIYYQGVDAARSLVEAAKRSNRNPNRYFVFADLTQSLSLPKKDFTHAVIILSLQNMDNPQRVFENCNRHLKIDGKLAMVLNHPCFRIPRQTGWGIEQRSKIQYRWINRYLSPLKIPVNIHPGQKNSPVAWSFHYSLSDCSNFLQQAGFVIEKIEEWVSDKKSVGKAAKMENLSRQEIPLFMAILARKERNP